MDRTASIALRFAPPPPPSKRNPEQNKTKKSRYAGYSPDKTFRFLACEQNHLRENWGKDKKGKGEEEGGGGGLEEGERRRGKLIFSLLSKIKNTQPVFRFTACY